MDTVLVYCTPGLPGAPRSGCAADRIRDGLTEVTTGFKNRISAHPDPTQFAPVAAAVSALEKSTAGLGPCDAYFSGSENEVECGLAWDQITSAWTRLKDAMAGK